MIDTNPLTRLQIHARQWSVILDNSSETASSLIAFGHRIAGEGQRERVVLKVIKREGDEWWSGETLHAFDGNGVALVYEHAPGAVLLERLSPGTSLANMSLEGSDSEATKILADVMQQMTIAAPKTERLTHLNTVWDWGDSFDRYTATRDDQIPAGIVAAAGRLYSNLCASQQREGLLHGDLQHYNVLFDSKRGWLAIDPKGVLGELEYEVGAMLRNPIERPELFTSRATIERRVKQIVDQLDLDYQRVVAWAFAQAVLSAIWGIEDGFAVDMTNPSLKLAIAIQPLLTDTTAVSSGI